MVLGSPEPGELPEKKPTRGWFLLRSFHFSFPAYRTSKNRLDLVHAPPARTKIVMAGFRAVHGSHAMQGSYPMRSVREMRSGDATPRTPLPWFPFGDALERGCFPCVLHRSAGHLSLPAKKTVPEAGGFRFFAKTPSRLGSFHLSFPDVAPIAGFLSSGAPSRLGSFHVSSDFAPIAN